MSLMMLKRIFRLELRTESLLKSKTLLFLKLTHDSIHLISKNVSNHLLETLPRLLEAPVDGLLQTSSLLLREWVGFSADISFDIALRPSVSFLSFSKVSMVRKSLTFFSLAIIFFSLLRCKISISLLTILSLNLSSFPWSFLAVVLSSFSSSSIHFWYYLNSNSFFINNLFKFYCFWRSFSICSYISYSTLLSFNFWALLLTNYSKSFDTYSLMLAMMFYWVIFFEKSKLLGFTFMIIF